jgi:hypothetical protein
MATAFLPKALLGCCDKHHKWFHAHPIDTKAIAIKILGSERYYAMLCFSNTVMKNINFKDIRDGLKRILGG